MKTFKTVDYVGQILLLLVSGSVALSTDFDMLGSPALNMYLVVGGWQVLSVIIHFFISKAYKLPLRKWYHILLILTVLIGIVMVFNDNAIPFFFGMLFWSPLLAILYLVCCYKETMKLSSATQGSELKRDQQN
jgi:amino acid transporter